MNEPNRVALSQELQRDESLKLFPYDDATGKPLKKGDTIVGNITIGIGRNLSDKGISPAEARFLVDNDINEVEEDLDARISWWRKLSDTRQRVLMNMCFNMGIDGLCSFTNTLAAMERGDFAAAARGMETSKWYGQVGNRAKRLVQMMKDG